MDVSADVLAGRWALAKGTPHALSLSLTCTTTHKPKARALSTWLLWAVHLRAMASLPLRALAPSFHAHASCALCAQLHGRVLCVVSPLPRWSLERINASTEQAVKTVKCRTRPGHGAACWQAATHGKHPQDTRECRPSEKRQKSFQRPFFVIIIYTSSCNKSTSDHIRIPAPALRPARRGCVVRFRHG